ncbi:hypothetical protein OG21DRAFT_1522244 [Imleria badia]|nr:hypothetical protein OG21DRAFT_1522244 [Imleria badia]
MTQLKSAFSQLLRLHPKYREQVCRRAVVTPAANTTGTYRKYKAVRKRAHLEPEFVVQDFELWTDTLSKCAEAEEYEDKDGDEVPKTHTETEVQNLQPPTDTLPENVEEIEEYKNEDDDEYEVEVEVKEEDAIPEVIPYDLARKTHNEMMTKRLYVAVTDNDCEIAALRTCHGEKFTHIVRVVFEPLTRHSNITPSCWTSENIYPDDGPCELRLTCPALTRHYTNNLTALTEKQLLAARNYITHILPDGDHAWQQKGLAFPVPVSPDECDDARVLIVGPSDRSADVMAILVCYMAFLTASRVDELLVSLRKFMLVRSHWGGNILGQQSLDLADAVSKQQWK